MDSLGSSQMQICSKLWLENVFDRVRIAAKGRFGSLLLVKMKLNWIAEQHLSVH
jgi:hypothetical protein